MPSHVKRGILDKLSAAPSAFLDQLICHTTMENRSISQLEELKPWRNSGSCDGINTHLLHASIDHHVRVWGVFLFVVSFSMLENTTFSSRVSNSGMKGKKSMRRLTLCVHQYFSYQRFPLFTICLRPFAKFR